MKHIRVNYNQINKCKLSLYEHFDILLHIDYILKCNFAKNFNYKASAIKYIDTYDSENTYMILHKSTRKEYKYQLSMFYKNAAYGDERFVDFNGVVDYLYRLRYKAVKYVY